MESKLYIPEKIKVGFKKDAKCFNELLAYIIYYDEKGKLRKEPSWQSWRDKTIPDIEFENKPRKGYLFNKGIQRFSYRHGSGRTMLRVYDPREFEIEIDIDNLEAILMNSNISKKEIEEECVYAWAGKDLILLPVNSMEYRESVGHTEKQFKNVSSKELIKGATYIQKKNEAQWVYLGHFNWSEDSGYDINKRSVDKGKKHLFYRKKEPVNGQYYITPVSMSTLAECINPETDINYANAVIYFEQSINYKPVDSFELKPINSIMKKDNIHTLSLMKPINNTLIKAEYVKISFPFCTHYNKKNIYEKLTIKFYSLINNQFEEVKLPHGYNRFMTNPRKDACDIIINELFKEGEILTFKEIEIAIKLAEYKQLFLKRIDGITYSIDD